MQPMLWHSVEKSEWDFKRQRTLYSEKGLPEDEWSSTSVCYRARLYPARSAKEEFKTLNCGYLANMCTLPELKISDRNLQPSGKFRFWVFEEGVLIWLDSTCKVKF